MPTPILLPHDVEKEHDVFFYGLGDKFRREWMEELIGAPSRALPDVDFVLGGSDFRGDMGRARRIGAVPFNVFPHAISASRINLNITRSSHATVPGSSTSRPFELAAAGAAIVSSPHAGIERWFKPGRELVVVENARGGGDLPGAAWRPGSCGRAGRRARERVLDEHTYGHRAGQLLELCRVSRPASQAQARR